MRWIKRGIAARRLRTLGFGSTQPKGDKLISSRVARSTAASNWCARTGRQLVTIFERIIQPLSHSQTDNC